MATCSENPHFTSILRSPGQEIIIGLRLKHANANAKERKTYIKRIQREHGDILDLNESLERYHHLAGSLAE